MRPVCEIISNITRKIDGHTSKKQFDTFGCVCLSKERDGEISLFGLSNRGASPHSGKIFQS